jgi:MFS family permease
LLYDGLRRRSPLKSFLTIWAGQFVSLIGSGLTGFGIGVWVFQQTRSATLFAIFSFCAMAPGILVTPFAGVLADRWGRRRTMILSDSGAAFFTLAIALLLVADRLQFWHLYIAAVGIASFSALQWPAYSAATTLLVPREQLPRADGSASGSSSGPLKPLSSRALEWLGIADAREFQREGRMP